MLRWLLTVPLMVAILGCERVPATPPPQTHAATGVLSQRDGQPVSSGRIQFKSADGTVRLSTTAPIQPDGSFTLQVMDIEGKKYLGAEAGLYTVIYLPVMSEAQSEQPVTLPGKVTVQEGENRFTLKLP